MAWCRSGVSEQQGADRARHGVFVGEDADDLAAALDLAV
jgi:hypothetical protein